MKKSKVMYAVGGCHIDLHPRSNNNLPQYGINLINTYIPISFVQMVTAEVERTTRLNGCTTYFVDSMLYSI